MLCMTPEFIRFCLYVQALHRVGI